MGESDFSVPEAVMLGDAWIAATGSSGDMSVLLSVVLLVAIVRMAIENNARCSKNQSDTVSSVGGAGKKR
jgi:hypothetical protein